MVNDHHADFWLPFFLDFEYQIEYLWKTYLLNWLFWHILPGRTATRPGMFSEPLGRTATDGAVHTLAPGLLGSEPRNAVGKMEGFSNKMDGIFANGMFLFFNGENDDSSMDYQWIINGFKENFLGWVQHGELGMNPGVSFSTWSTRHMPMLVFID